jgi:cell division protein FtsI/penicillin-binding protein 2
VFERRLKLLLTGFALAMLVIVGRLVQLQVVDAAYYTERTAQSLKRNPKQVPFVRGSILDRTGAVLVRDEPSWEIAVDYGVIAADVGDDPSVEVAMAEQLLAVGRDSAGTTSEEVVARWREELALMWDDISRFMGVDGQAHVAEDLRARAKGIYEQLSRVRRVVAKRRGFDAPIAEENRAHAIISGLSAADQIAAREVLSGYPWVHVRPSSERRYAHDALPFAHVLGRLGRVDATLVSNDVNADDPFARYLADEYVGIAGVEWAGEEQLRGRRGQVAYDREGHTLDPDNIEPQNGSDVRLTLHTGLQHKLYDLLGRVVDSVPASSGGSIVVLDVARRDVLALVSYPSYEPSRFSEDYGDLRDDTRRLPLRFRAVSNQYAPGSTVKPLTCLAGLMNGVITPSYREECTGYLFPDVRERWRCWQIHGTDERKAHGPVNVTEALTGSCNVFMYRLGERLGVDALCSVFDMVRIGRTSGIGLREEVGGINPTPSWLMAHKNMRATAGTARLFAIGQGELSMTPVQVANLMATYATGRYRPVRLIQSQEPTPEWIIPASDEQWQAIRRGIYGVVNDPGGTAHAHVRFQSDDWLLCAKTGSATAHPWPTAYRVHYEDEEGVAQVELVRAGAKNTAMARFVRAHPGATFDPADIEVAARWPLDPPSNGQRHAHAWVAGYLQARDPDGRPDWSREPKVAFAILVEFGGSGGRTTGPLAGDVSMALLDTFGTDLVIGNDDVVARASP